MGKMDKVAVCLTVFFNISTTKNLLSCWPTPPHMEQCFASYFEDADFSNCRS